ncbi:hypothetical protein [Gordonia sp. ABSL49_1]|uniref:hypothetical protein n=1 Tax=unclassified Gordonia (in: high G+C Gram-positive bacteria) TaxID=2657482 RepID=UPI001F0DB411|nr:hypothetical protein [Gordonia sp. ABSL49_1]MCH5645511.1 hypothetical protein [Gordonia sp. ABSL49_1]
MKKLTWVLGFLALALAAILVVPTGTAGATPAGKVPTHNANATISPSGDTITVELRDGKFVPNQENTEIKVVDGRGNVTETVPLMPVSNGKTVHVRAVVSQDGKTATFHGPVATPVAKKKPGKRMTRDQAFQKMTYQLNKDWPCAAPYIIGGALIGLFFIVGWVIGGAIGAYIGYTTCNHGAGFRSVVTWWNTP